MTEEQVENTPLMDFLNREDFNGLSVYESRGKHWWKIDFIGVPHKDGINWEFDGVKSPHRIFTIYKCRNQN